jgi:hypothetical protein
MAVIMHVDVRQKKTMHQDQTFCCTVRCKSTIMISALTQKHLLSKIHPLCREPSQEHSDIRFPDSHRAPPPVRIRKPDVWVLHQLDATRVLTGIQLMGINSRYSALSNTPNLLQAAKMSLDGKDDAPSKIIHPLKKSLFVEMSTITCNAPSPRLPENRTERNDETSLDFYSGISAYRV